MLRESCVSTNGAMNMKNKVDIVTVESPCVRSCCLDEQDICLGCFRSLDEIIQWTLVDEKSRQQFLQNSFERKKKHNVNRKF
ncbi:MAG: DUF1289 domain-containing protein [Methylococcaceae bacterium]